VMASGDIPDIMHDWGLGANYEKWSLQGLFVDLDKYNVRDPAKYPNISLNVTPKHWSMAEVPARDYHAFTVPRPHYIPSYGPAYRKDWLDKLGLSFPLTIAEFERACDQFVRGDPDGNGRADTNAFSLTPGTGGPGTLTFL
jgi:putative aldouronate transport system substrate-binding protein